MKQIKVIIELNIETNSKYAESVVEDIIRTAQININSTEQKLISFDVVEVQGLDE